MNPAIFYLVIILIIAVLLDYGIVYAWKEHKKPNKQDSSETDSSVYRKNSTTNLKDLQVLINLPSHQIQQSHILIAALAVAIIAQILIFEQMRLEGAFLYLLAILGFLIWIRANPSSAQAIAESLHLNRQGWLLLMSTVILLTISTRFFDVHSGVYGLDADEAKWTVQAWESGILHLNVSEFPTQHYKYQPVDFWTKSIFLRIFGINFVSARIQSAVFSLISVICLYGLAKQVTSNTAVGLLSSLIFSLSFIELNVSHQALYSTPPMTWMLSCLAVFFMAIYDRKLWQFQLSGILLGLGMLTYDTFYPTAAAVFAYLLIIAISEIRRRQTPVKNWLIYSGLFTWPTILVYFTFIKEYLNEYRQFYLFGLLRNASAAQNLYSLIQFFAGNFLNVLEILFSQIIWGDSLIAWNGPLLNPFILPFMVMGLVYNLWNIRQAHFAFPLLLYFMHAGIGSILIGASWPRVMYLSIPPLMIWAGLGLWITLTALRGFFRNQKAYVPVSIFAFILAVIFINDYHIFQTKIIDRLDHQKRRELSEITIASAKSPSILLYPFVSGQKDFVDLDSHVIRYSIAGEKDMGVEVTDHFGLVDMKMFMQSLWSNRNNGEIDVIFDKTPLNLMEERTNSLKAVLFCYPQAQLSHQGRFFDVYHFSKQTLNSPACYSPRKPFNISPTGNIPQTKTSSLSFQWDAGEVQSSRYFFLLEKKMADTLWVEVEQSFIGNGWLKESTGAEGYSANGYLSDAGPEVTGEAVYTVDIENPGNYYIWFRSYERRDNDQRSFVTVGGTKTEIAKTGQELNKWVWESTGPYNLPAGETAIRLTREYGNDELYSTFIDAMVVTANVNFHPVSEDKIWQDVYTLENSESTASSLTLQEALPIGTYRWSVRIFSEENIVDSNGNPGIESDKSFFQVVE